MSGQNGKGRGPMKGYNHKAFWDNYDAVFRKPKHKRARRGPSKLATSTPKPRYPVEFENAELGDEG